ncbi:hypothetical protein [Ruania zhangjianzhongii]|uniref:hypothetical protein n=1 Tax=Ruania zhangjianzhongii TaxID=2603206 RepID=UPI0011C7B3BE|nr:hypothetical protein [Ruania zhangjianzhongii]
MPASPFRRPAILSAEQAENLTGEPDPAERNELAHTTATAIVQGGRDRVTDEDLQRRLVELVDAEGLDLLAQLWSASPAETLPGALWRLYLLREWTQRDPHTISERYHLGLHRAEVPSVVAGVASPPGPQEVCDLSDAVLRGVFSGDLDVALDRAAAFLHVLVSGTALDADWVETTDADSAEGLTRRAGALQSTAEDLQQAAALWRAGKLD